MRIVVFLLLGLLCFSLAQRPVTASPTHAGVIVTTQQQRDFGLNRYWALAIQSYGIIAVDQPQVRQRRPS
jgi:hypothetical protein